MMNAGAFDENKKKDEQLANLSVEEREKKEKEEEKKRKESLDKFEAQQKLKNKLDIKLDLENLQNLIEEGILDESVAKDIVKASTDLSNDEINEIFDHIDIQKAFDKINEIEDIKDIDKTLPKELRVTIDEYQKAIKDEGTRNSTLQKLDEALDFLATQATGGDRGMSIFNNFIMLLNTKLVRVQENTIDIKDTLIEVDQHIKGTSNKSKKQKKKTA